MLAEDADGHSDSRRGAIRLIAINPTLRAECERLLPMLEVAKAPASREEIVVVIAREMPAWGVSGKHAAIYGVTYASYADALEGLPLYAIEEGVVRWNRAQGHEDLKMGGFPPRPAQLYALAAEGRRELFMAAYRAKLAMEHVERETPKVDPAVQAKVGADLAALASTLRAKPMPEMPQPKCSPQEMAAQLRAAGAQARGFGAPISRKHIDADPGDVV